MMEVRGTPVALAFTVSCCMLLALLPVHIVANDNLRVAYQWKEIDFEFPSETERQEAIASKSYIAENVIPVGLEVYKKRLFLTLPRWKEGIPASLAYININGKLYFSPFKSKKQFVNCQRLAIPGDSNTNSRSSGSPYLARISMV